MLASLSCGSARCLVAAVYLDVPLAEQDEAKRLGENRTLRRALLIHRPEAHEPDDPRSGEADLIMGKHRNGPAAHDHGGTAVALLTLHQHGLRLGLAVCRFAAK